MSVHRIRRSGGRYIYEVRWREGGRSGVQRSRSFDRRQDAEFFEATRRRASQLGQLSAEVIGSEQTVEALIESGGRSTPSRCWRQELAPTTSTRSPSGSFPTSAASGFATFRATQSTPGEPR